MSERLVAVAETGRGYAIGVVGRGGSFEVVRMDRRSRYVTIDRFDTEDAARARANSEWRADTAALA